MARAANLPLVCIDPGKWRCGFAVFNAGVLVDVAELSSTTAIVGPALAVAMRAPWHARYLAEEPQTYEGHRDRDEDLETLRDMLREVERLSCARIRRIRPWGWKGNVPKAVHHARLIEALAASERALVEALPRNRDALDAVGLGLWHLGRTGRGARTTRR